ncbi:CDP-alcohol phosphatidyltransferase family protein [Flavobacterium algicola]|uniref:CDP-alcohol phosphatidyltransferase family protein n=1 Tax=Flavobacterium algicola TaxID=556529 RepID=UPI001EFEB5BB|nr:CDP-alcohol phosphatidyltransferase family protein [Flavobacterium algicola]MCG9792424.1 CDP-alcohol phosphatidyltransferase family protein [Flavobacterium algicola]
MSKLTAQDQFIDLSDYGRPFGKLLANSLKNTRFTAIDVTLLFGFSGLIAIYCIIAGHMYWAGFFLILKSIIDAADGELARIKNKPSYTGRYLDSVFDILLNFLILSAICYASNSPYWLTLIAFACIQLQGTLYNFYYVILRHKSAGADATSMIFEHAAPQALRGEKQGTVNLMFKIYRTLYGQFDTIIYALDSKAYTVKTFPRWFMTVLSLYGLGFQLLLIAIMLALGLTDLIVPFFIIYSFLLVVLIPYRRIYIQ